MKKPTIKSLRKKLENADKVVSAVYSEFQMKYYDLDSIYYCDAFDAFFIKDKSGNNDRLLYDCYDGSEFEILTKTQ